MARTLLAAVFAAALAVPALASAQATEESAAYARAAELEQQGHPAEAALALEPLRATHAEDYALVLRLAWLEFSAQQYAAADRDYRAALALSAGSSPEARLGLAWTLFRTGQFAHARRTFQRVLARDPENASARQGLALAQSSEPRMFRLWASLTGVGSGWSSHPSRRWAAGASASAVVQLADWVLLGATYRVLAYDYASNQGTGSLPPPPPPRPGLPPPPMPPAGASSTNVQHTVFGMVGLTRSRFALRLHFGAALDSGNSLAPVYVFGASATVQAHGAMNFETSGSIYQDGAWLRTAAAWDIALPLGFSVGPTAALQYGAGAVGGSFGARVGYTHSRFALTLAGRYGDEVRTAYLQDSLVYASNDHLRGALGLTARITLGAGLSLTVGYEWQRYAVTLTSGGTQSADNHAATLGLLGSW